MNYNSKKYVYLEYKDVETHLNLIDLIDDIIYEDFIFNHKVHRFDGAFQQLSNNRIFENIVCNQFLSHCPSL